MDQGTEASTEMELLFTSDRGGFIFHAAAPVNFIYNQF